MQPSDTLTCWDQSGSSSLCSWLTCQMWTKPGRRATIAALWLALCPAVLLCGDASLQNVLITQSSPLPPEQGSLCPPSFLTYFNSAFTRSVPVWFTLTLSLTVSLHFLPSPSFSLRVAKMGSSRASGRLLTQEQRVIELNALNMSLWHFHEAYSEGQQSLTSRIPMLLSEITESLVRLPSSAFQTNKLHQARIPYIQTKPFKQTVRLMSRSHAVMYHHTWMLRLWLESPLFLSLVHT